MKNLSRIFLPQKFAGAENNILQISLWIMVSCKWFEGSVLPLGCTCLLRRVSLFISLFEIRFSIRTFSFGRLCETFKKLYFFYKTLFIEMFLMYFNLSQEPEDVNNILQKASLGV